MQPISQADSRRDAIRETQEEQEGDTCGTHRQGRDLVHARTRKALPASLAARPDGVSQSW